MPTDTARAATAIRAARPRCCRSRNPRRRPAGTRPRRPREQVSPEWRCRTRCGSGGGSKPCRARARLARSRPAPARGMRRSRRMSRHRAAGRRAAASAGHAACAPPPRRSPGPPPDCENRRPRATGRLRGPHRRGTRGNSSRRRPRNAPQALHRRAGSPRRARRHRAKTQRVRLFIRTSTTSTKCH